MAELEAATERAHHGDVHPPGVDNDAEGDGPRVDWTMLPRDARFDRFNGAICLDIRRTYAATGGLALEGHQRVDCNLETDLITNALTEYGEGSTKVIICLRSRDPRDGLLPLPMTENTYTRLALRYEFSPLIFKVLYTGLATVCRYSSATGEQYIFQQNATGKCSMSIIISCDTTKRSTLGLIFGARQSEADAFIDLLLNGGQNQHWSTLALTALELTADDFSNQIKLRHNAVWKVGNSLKMDAWAADHEEVDIKTLDLIGATRSLNSLFVELANDSQACQTSHSLLRDIEKMVELDSAGPPNRHTATIKAVKENIQRLRSWYDGIQARSDYLTRRCEALLQTVYSLISQRDSAVNLEIAQRSGQVAEQSMEIAQLSRQDNLAMREVAIAAAKDSATMRVIAAVTLFFLPPTFVATFFSTSFLDFKPTSPGDHMSNWIWLYFVLTIILIAVVMGFWKLSTRHALRNIPSST